MNDAGKRLVMLFAILTITVLAIGQCTREANAHENCFWKHGATGKLYGTMDVRYGTRVYNAEEIPRNYQGYRWVRVIFFHHYYIDDNKKVQVHRSHEDFWVNSFEQIEELYEIWDRSCEAERMGRYGKNN